MSFALPDYRAGRCLRYRFRYSACSRCADACPHEAVTLSDEGVALDAARCQNCALCTSACPTAALAPGNLRPVELLKQAVKGGGIAIACGPSQEPGDAIVPCLGALDAGMLGYLAKRRIPAELRGSHHCADCPHGEKGAAQLALNLEAVEVLRQGAGEEPWLDIALPGPVSGTHAAKAFAPARRQLFRRLVGRGVDEVAAAAAGAPVEAPPIPEKAIRAAAPFLPEQRELFLIIGKRNDGGAFAVPRHAALPLMDVTLDSGRCTACEACFRVCPTGAMQVVDDSQSWTLTFERDRCVGCELCLETCQPRALAATEAVDLRPGAGRRGLHGLSKQRCSCCDRFFISPQPKASCPVCEDDSDAFAAIFG